MHTRLSALAAAIALAVGVALSAAPARQAAPEYGPPNGALVIAGGGNLSGTGIFEKFIELGRGADAGRFVIVPTAGGNRDRDGNVRQYEEESIVASWKRMGVANVTMLHTHDKTVADTEAFVAPLREATAVWFNGGRQWNIVDSYAGTRTFDEFHAVLERGGVIGGSSAGATIQGHYLVRGDTSGPNVMMTEEPEHQHGFAFLKQSAIDQHINTRDRWDHLIPVIERFQDLLGIGLAESTAIVVSGDTFEVIGKWKVAVHDNARLYQPWEKPYFVLSPGDRYDMKARRVSALGNGTSPRGRGAGGGESDDDGEAASGARVAAAAQAVTRYVRYQSAAGATSYGILEGESVRELSGGLFDAPTPTGRTVPLADVTLLAPVEPSKVIAVGLNYRSHLGTREPAAYPGLFAKYPTSVVGPGADIVLPPDAGNVHYEGEMVLVIGRRARNVPAGQSAAYIFGVTAGNDVSERDWQSADLQWFRAKAADTFAPIGPAVVTGLDPDDLLVQTRLNGEVVQSERTRDLIFDTDAIVTYISRYITLLPGDVIFTGTPQTTRPFTAGDVIEVEVEGVGVLRNQAVRGDGSPPVENSRGMTYSRPRGFSTGRDPSP
jgi:cyanophycinase